MTYSPRIRCQSMTPLADERLSRLIVSSPARRHLIMARPETRTAKKIEPVKLSDTKIGTLKADKLREELTRGKIRTPDNSLKPKLQALYALWKLCLLFPEEIPDHEMLDTVARWCSMSTAKLLTTIAKQSLKSSGTKWDNVEVLIEHG